MLRLAAAGAIDRQEPWLHHPFLNPLTLRCTLNKRDRDFQLAVWIAANSDNDLGFVTLDEATRMWSPAGGAVIPPGVHSLSELGRQLRGARSPVAIPLDVWCWSVGYPIEDSWGAVSDQRAQQNDVLADEIVTYCRTIERLQHRLPEILEWISAATSVVVPLRNPGLDVVRSCSRYDLPGLVWTDLVGGSPQILETVVHESAHNHFYAVEAEGPLVDPKHEGYYSSPLRPEPRPLRGILLALHALAYICAAFIDAKRVDYFQHAFPENTLADLIRRRFQAERTLIQNRRHLTEHGRQFLGLTRQVCAYGSTTD